MRRWYASRKMSKASFQFISFVYAARVVDVGRPASRSLRGRRRAGRGTRARRAGRRPPTTARDARTKTRPAASPAGTRTRPRSSVSMPRSLPDADAEEAAVSRVGPRVVGADERLLLPRAPHGSCSRRVPRCRQTLKNAETFPSSPRTTRSGTPLRSCGDEVTGGGEHGRMRHDDGERAEEPLLLAREALFTEVRWRRGPWSGRAPYPRRSCGLRRVRARASPGRSVSSLPWT